jgi:hypothetical protein
MFNFTERLRKVNFAKYDNDKIKLGVDEGEAAILKEGLLKPKDDPEYKQSLSKVISSYTTLTETAADSDFMQKFKSHHKDDGEYDKFNKMVDIAVMTKEKARKNKENDLNKAKRNMEVTASVAEAVTSGMEDPAKSFFNSLFKIMQDEKMNALKLKEIKDDDLDFDLSAEVDKATGNEGTLDKAAESQGVKLDPPENKSTESSEGKPEVPSESAVTSDPKSQELNNKDKLEAIKKSLMDEWDSNKWSSGSMESKIELVKDKKFDDFLRDEHKRAWRSVHKEIGDLDQLENKSDKDKDSSKKNFSERIELAIGVSNELSGTDW